jgi:uncharacterized delta-60 repeat protein
MVNIYSDCIVLSVGCHLYTDSGLTIPVPNNFYSDNSVVYQVTSGAGLITDESTCGSFNFGTGYLTTRQCFAMQDDGKLVVGGGSGIYQGVSVNRINRINTDGSNDVSFVLGSGFDDGTVQSIAIQPDGKLVVGGSFTSYNGVGATRIIRLNPDGSRDTSFVIGSGFDDYPHVAIQSDGKIVCVGDFSSYNGNGATRVARLNTDGSFDSSYITGSGFNIQVNNVVLQPDNKALCCGSFTSYNGVGANRIIRLNTDGSRDTSFVIGSGCDSDPRNFVIQSDGKIVVIGGFSSYNGTGKNCIMRLNTNGSIDSSFVTGSGFNNIPFHLGLAIQSDGKIVCCGSFTTYNGTTANRIIRLNTDGSIDSSFVTGSGFGNQAQDVLASSCNIQILLPISTTYNGSAVNGLIVNLSSTGVLIG